MPRGLSRIGGWLPVSSAFALALTVAAGCATDRWPPPPPDPPPAVFDEWGTGACPESLDWYWHELDPWMDAYCRAQNHSEECGT